ncbi:MAG: AmmeMemoRadiSam system protein B, partial [Chloroflexota bacterium]
MIREPAVAGQFYPERPYELKSMIKGMVDATATKEDVIGLIAPHAGYIYSGAVTGATISRVKFKDTFVIIGPNHTGAGKPLSIMTEGVWKTPLGEVEIDSELAKKILEGSKYLQEDFLAHEYEHSIEVQLPFLQYFKPNIKIVPIILSYVGGEVYKEIGKEIARAIKESGKGVVIIASSDMTHYEPQEYAREQDTKAIDAILALDEDLLLKRVKGLDITMCGYAPAVCLISAAKALGTQGARLVKYQTSGDTTGDYSSVVGYAGVIINAMSPLAKLARDTIETYIREGKVIKPKELAPEMKEKAGVFVTIHKNGDLRGCIGTFDPATSNVGEEIVRNAISSATDDPRFQPVTPNELKDLDYSVDVLTSPEAVESKEQLDPKKYGNIVQSG